MDKASAGGLRGEVRAHVSAGVVHDGAHRRGVLPRHEVSVWGASLKQRVGLCPPNESFIHRALKAVLKYQCGIVHD